MSARSFKLNGKMKQGNITVLNDEKVAAVILHRTTVVLFAKAENKIILTSGGWTTNTTKTAINNALNQLESMTGNSLPRIYQKNFQWYLTDGRKFEDNMTLELSELMQQLA